jgi:hypothetical protein
MRGQALTTSEGGGTLTPVAKARKQRPNGFSQADGEPSHWSEQYEKHENGHCNRCQRTMAIEFRREPIEGWVERYGNDDAPDDDRQSVIPAGLAGPWPWPPMAHARSLSPEIRTHKQLLLRPDSQGLEFLASGAHRRWIDSPVENAPRRHSSSARHCQGAMAVGDMPCA